MKVIATIFDPSLDQDNSASTRLSNETKKEEWFALSIIYDQLIESARKEEDFTDEEISDFHDQCGVFMTAWVGVTNERNHVSNYIHMIGSGHLVYYLKLYHNLYKKISNQGWEALNKKIKRVYFYNTNHGGSSGGRARIEKGYVEPLWLFLARSTMWKIGVGIDFFLQQAVVG